MTIHHGSGAAWDHDPELTLKGTLPYSPEHRHALLSRLALEIHQVAEALTENDLRLLRAIAAAGSIKGAVELLEPASSDPERYLRKRLDLARRRIQDFLDRTISGRLLLGIWERSSEAGSAPDRL